MPATATYETTRNAYIDGLLGDRKWALKDLTFRFPDQLGSIFIM